LVRNKEGGSGQHKGLTLHGHPALLCHPGVVHKNPPSGTRRRPRATRDSSGCLPDTTWVCPGGRATPPAPSCGAYRRRPHLGVVAHCPGTPPGCIAEWGGQGGHARKNGFWAQAPPTFGGLGAVGAAATGRPGQRARWALLARRQPTGHVPASLQSRGSRGCPQGVPKNRGLGPKGPLIRDLLQHVAALAALPCFALARWRIFGARNFF